MNARAPWCNQTTVRPLERLTLRTHVAHLLWCEQRMPQFICHASTPSLPTQWWTRAWSYHNFNIRQRRIDNAEVEPAGLVERQISRMPSMRLKAGQLSFNVLSCMSALPKLRARSILVLPSTQLLPAQKRPLRVEPPEVQQHIDKVIALCFVLERTTDRRQSSSL